MKKVVACIIVCCILLCLFSFFGKKETYMELYVSKELPKNTIILNDTERIITNIEDGGDKWVLTVTSENWYAYRDKAINFLKQNIVNKFMGFGIDASINKLEINNDFTYMSVSISIDGSYSYYMGQYIISEIGTLIRKLKFSLYGNYEIKYDIYDAQTHSIIK